MRSFSSSWTNTLTTLGFKRRKTSSKSRYRRQRSSIERLEDRQLMAVYTVNSVLDNTTGGDGFTTLREAVAAANASPGADTINFNSSLIASGPATIQLSAALGQLTLSHDVTINGLGTNNLSIDAQGNSRALAIQTGVNASITDLTIENGYLASGNTGAGVQNYGNLTLDRVDVANNHIGAGDWPDNGGGVFSQGALHILDSTIENNSANWGGGIAFNAVDSSDVLEIRDSSILNNDGGAGAGLSYQGNGPSVQIVDSTFSGNVSPWEGGGLWFDDTTTPVTITNSTISENQAQTGGGGGIFSTAPTTLYNTIVAKNDAPTVYSIWTFHSYDDLYVTAIDTNASTNNLVGIVGYSGLTDTTAHPNQLGSESVPLDPKLQSLGAHGGDTETYALATDSPAIDAGSNLTAIGAGLVKDQNGYDRYVGQVDVGATEFSGPLQTPADSGAATYMDDNVSSFGFSWDLANNDHLVLHTDPGNSDAVRWVGADGLLINTSIGVASAADSSASVITRGTASGTYVRIDKFGNESDYTDFGSGIAILMRSVDRHGVGNTYQYDNPYGDYRITSVSAVRPGQLDETTTFTYTGDLITSVTDPYNRTAYIYYSGDVLSEIQLPAPDSSNPTVRPTFLFGYDSSTDFLNSITDADNRVTTFGFAANGEFTVTYPDTGSEQVVPGINDVFNGWRSELGDWASVLPAFKYKSIFDPDGTGASSTGYGIDQLGRTTTITTDASGNITDVVDPAHQTTHTTYNAAGLPLEIKVTGSGSAGVVSDTHYTYDTKNNLKRVDYLDGTYETWTYDPNFSQVTEHRDQQGRYTEYTVNSSTGDTTEVRTIVGSDDRTSSQHDDVVTQYVYTSDGLVADEIQLRNDAISGTAQLSDVTQYSYANVTAGGANHVGRVMSSITYGGDDPTVAGLSLVNAATVSILARNAFGMPTEVQDEMGRDTYYEYDNLDRLTKITSPPPGNSQATPVETFSYTLAGLLVDDKQTDTTGSQHITTHYDYDRNGRIQDVIQDDGGANQAETSYVYDAAGNVIQTTDPLNHTTAYAYDELNRPIAETDADPDGTAGPLTSPVTIVAYDALGDVTAERDPTGAVWQWEYDTFGRVTKQTDPTDNVTQLHYNADGQLTDEIDAQNRDTVITYDDAGRVASIKEPGIATATVYAYDSAGNLRYVTDPLGHVAETQYDERDRVTKQINGDGDATTFTYYNDNQIKTLSDSDISRLTPNGNTTTFAYDGAGRESSNTNQQGYAETYLYDAYGELTQLTDRDGRVTDYTYDDLHQLKTESWYSATNVFEQTISYNFDAVGNLLSVTDPTNANYTFQYDALNRQIGVTQQIAGLTPTIQLNHSFDAAGRLASATAVIGTTADYANTYTYDAAGRLQTLIQAGQTGGEAVGAKRVDFSYNADGQLSEIQRFANTAQVNPVATSQYSYDSSTGRLTSIDHASTASGSSFTDNLSYGNDAANRLTSSGSSLDARSAAYTYDNADQLTSVTYTGGGTNESYSYGVNGNREEVHDISPFELDYGTTVGADSYQTDGVYDYGYDKQGNLVAKVDIQSFNQTVYVWDNRNRLIEVKEYDGHGTPSTGDDTLSKDVTYRYDAFNQLVFEQVVSAGVTTQTAYVNDGGQVTLQFDKTGTGNLTGGNLSHRYLWGAAVDQLLADDQVSWSGSTPSSEVLWALTDDLGSVRDVIGSNGVLRVHRQFDAFGNITSELHYNSSGTAVTAGQAGYVDEAFAFTGKYFDKNTGLQNNHNRWYDSFTGRWISQDPMGFAAGDANLYRYANNEPTALVDPSGLTVDRSEHYGGGVWDGNNGQENTDPNHKFPERLPGQVWVDDHWEDPNTEVPPDFHLTVEDQSWYDDWGHYANPFISHDSTDWKDEALQWGTRGGQGLALIGYGGLAGFGLFGASEGGGAAFGGFGSFGWDGAALGGSATFSGYQNLQNQLNQLGDLFAGAYANKDYGAMQQIGQRIIDIGNSLYGSNN